MHVGVLDFSGLLVKLQNVAHPKSDEDEGEGVSSKDGDESGS